VVENSVSRPDHRDDAREVHVSDFHLVESMDGWTLTINLTDAVLTALLADPGDRSTPQLARRSSTEAPRVTLHVEPNLLPGEPFTAEIVVTRPTR
jgi:hypothetical protein